MSDRMFAIVSSKWVPCGKGSTGRREVTDSVPVALISDEAAANAIASPIEVQEDKDSGETFYKAVEIPVYATADEFTAGEAERNREANLKAISSKSQLKALEALGITLPADIQAQIDKMNAEKAAKEAAKATETAVA